MNKNWAIRKDAEAVSPVIATILMVAITVVLAAVLYVMVLGFGTGGGSTPGLSVSRTANAAGTGWDFTCTAPTSTVSWNDCTVILEDTTNGNLVQWADISASALSTGVAVTYTDAGAETLTTLAKFLNVTDMGGNGEISNGDIIKISGSWTAGVQYKLTLLYEQDDGTMASSQWTQ
jgi:flagellin-like protein